MFRGLGLAQRNNIRVGWELSSPITLPAVVIKRPISAPSTSTSWLPSLTPLPQAQSNAPKVDLSVQLFSPATLGMPNACSLTCIPSATKPLKNPHDIVQREGVHMGRVLHVPLEPRFSPYETLPSSLNSTSSALTSLIAPFDAMFKLWNVVEQITTECPVANVQSLERTEWADASGSMSVMAASNCEDVDHPVTWLRVVPRKRA
ncbi:hypothetical protein BGY98DRAFT_934599 [Russula aff. rugulosa BPL654]|nr:hypothetical protein BGY98DRAFT_934599 [Russula aff. rugulosa BPL654]